MVRLARVKDLSGKFQRSDPQLRTIKYYLMKELPSPARPVLYMLDGHVSAIPRLYISEIVKFSLSSRKTGSLMIQRQPGHTGALSKSVNLPNSISSRSVASDKAHVEWIET